MPQFSIPYKKEYTMDYNEIPFRWEQQNHTELTIEPNDGFSFVKHISYKHGDIGEHNAKIAHSTIWKYFKKFARKCMRKIHPHNRTQKIEFLSTCGMPTAIMPDGSEIISLHTFYNHYMRLDFVWVQHVETSNE